MTKEDYCLDCEHSHEKLKVCVPDRCQKHLEVEICEGCDGGILWGTLNYDDVITRGNGRLEFWGAPCEETIVVGYICPLCGHENRF